jgi:1-acyl-sn-glycerol-3-phosphate acyltransferase
LFYWFLKFIAIGPVVHAVFRPRAEGTEHVPEAGAAILASNHLSAADWIHMPLSLKRRVTFLAKAEYFTGKGIKGALQRAFPSTGRAPRPPRTRSRRVCASCARASCSASTRRARGRRTPGSTAARPASRG